MSKVFFFLPTDTNECSHKQMFVRVGVGLVKYRTNVRIWGRAPTRIYKIIFGICRPCQTFARPNFHSIRELRLRHRLPCTLPIGRLAITARLLSIMRLPYVLLCTKKGTQGERGSYLDQICPTSKTSSA